MGITIPSTSGEAQGDGVSSGGTSGPHVEFAAFLKARRRSIPPESTALGSWERLPVRLGRRVTQEEVAEAVGVSRNWYRRLEGCKPPRASAKLLARIAGALQLTSEERTMLFALGIPEIGQMLAA